VLLNLAEWSFH